MESVQYYIDKLKEHGYEPKDYLFTDSQLESICLFKGEPKSDSPYISIETSYTEEYEEELSKLEEGEEFEVDLSKCVIRYITFTGNISYQSSTKEMVLGPQEIEKYFDKALKIFENPTGYVWEYMKYCRDSLWLFNNFIRPTLEKYHYEESYNSFWDISERSETGSEFVFCYTYKYCRDSVLTFRVNLLSGELLWDYGKVNDLTFTKDLLEKEMGYDKDGDIDIRFEYLISKDPTFTPTSYQDILALLNNIRFFKGGFKYVREIPQSKINFKNIPESYHYLIDEYLKLYNKAHWEEISKKVIEDYEAFKELNKDRLPKNESEIIHEYLEECAFYDLNINDIRELLINKYVK